MPRTVISLSDEDKAWLDRTARSQRIPMTRLVQAAVRRMREAGEAEPGGIERLLRETAGIRRAGDALAEQRKLRKEWDGRG